MIIALQSKQSKCLWNDTPIIWMFKTKLDDFENLRVIKSKGQAPNFKKILTKAEFSLKKVGVF